MKKTNPSNLFHRVILCWSLNIFYGLLNKPSFQKEKLIRPNINNRFYIKGNKISTTRKRLKTLDVQFKSLAYRNQKSTSPQIILKIHELFLTHKTLDKVITRHFSQV